MPLDDRRVRKTRRALAEALLALASARPYETINIRDITERADVGYATFFRHYGGKDDLMLEVFADVARGLESAPGQHEGDFFENEGQLIFEHVRDNQALYRSILDSLVFTRRLKAILAKHIHQQMARHRQIGSKQTEPKEIAVNHMVAGLVGLIEWWLAHKLQPPAERMAEIYDRLIIQATWQALLGEGVLRRP